MRREWLIVFVVFGIVFLTGSGAMADIGDVAYEKVQALVATGHNSGHTAGTILNPEGRGDVLMFPYYDVREVYGKAQDFYFAIINDEWECESSTAQCYAGIAAKLRFREWSKGEELFNVDIWLSRGDVWVGVLTYNTLLALPFGARIASPDVVIIDHDTSTFTLSTPFTAGFDFPTAAIIPSGSSNLMGYFEVIGEERTYDKQSSGKVTRVTVNVDAPNSLMGYAYIVRVAEGQSFAYNASAIANFARNKGSLFSGAGSPSPTLMDCEDTLDQLEFQIAKKEGFAGYSVEDAIAGKFSLILTFPTKSFHFCGKPNYTIKGDAAALCTADYPVGSPFTGKIELDGLIFDRNQNGQDLIMPCFLGPCPLPPPPPDLPWGVNLIGLYKEPPPLATVPATGLRDNVAFSTGAFESGFIRVNFPNTGYVQPLNPKITSFLNYDDFFSGYEGLPVLGLALQEFQNSNVGGFYGDTREVFYKTKWITE